MSGRIKNLDDDGIERIPEYYEFIAQLQQFHDSIGTFLQVEPILGGKKLDLRRIYLGVKHAGGFEKVTEEHGWQKIANPFDFPPTCTNSAYVIKRAYKQSLYNYAQVTDYGVPISQIKIIENASKRFQDDDGGASSKKAKTRNQFQPTVPSVTMTSTYVAPQRGNGAPIKVIEFAPDDKYLQGGAHNKILLALQSDLPNEVDWAFNKLVKLSSSTPPNFHIGSIPGLIEAIIAHTDAFFALLKLNTAADNFETSPDFSKPEHLTKLPNFSELTLFNLKECATMLDRVLQIMHILRNFSFTEPHAKFFINQNPLLTVLAKSLALPCYSIYTTLKLESLEIFENLAGAINLRGRNDFYLACLRKILTETNDKALLLGSLRSFTKLCATDGNHAHLMDMDATVLDRCIQLLRVRGDDFLIYLTLEFIYSYSCLGVDAIARVVACAAPSNIVRLFMSFLHLRPNMDVKPAKTKMVMGPPMPPPLQPYPQQQMNMPPGGNMPGFRPPGFMPPSMYPGTPMWNAGPVNNMDYNQPLKRGPKLGSKRIPKMESGTSTPVRSQAASQVNSSAVSPALHRTTSKSVSYKEDDDIDIDGDEDEVLEEGRAGGSYVPSGQSQSTPAARSTSGPAGPSLTVPTPQDPFSITYRKRGRPPKNKAELDAYSVQLQQQITQEHAAMLKQNPSMGDAEKTVLVTNLQQKQQMLLLQFAGAKSVPTPAPAATPIPAEREVDQYAGGGGNFGYVGMPNNIPVINPVVAPVEEEDIPADPSFECHWTLSDGSECPLEFASETEIISHMAEEHFATPNQLYRCQWSGCHAYHAAPTGRGTVFKHVRTHVGDSSKKTRGFSQPLFKKPFKSGGIDGPELAGIPLTTLLILRNLARSQIVREMFLEFEYDLALAMAERPKYSKVIAEVLWELR
ncbi:hypothetical protein CcCBS67573_g08367 [Chytriomyces confervae]|uniref:ARID domain-containing protein n=1 Tax=Chytriomyces confervae TaxID=246404 RepID=A0A507EL47_9FUNG|nr:AT-rich interactive domain-containing protein 2 [Chytriomyces hyalinus]TPX64584.1 hypothetical protein CcCBS67573_g08367 [Chytriomyces confervae]